MKTKILVLVLNLDKKTDAQTPSGLINYINMNENLFLKKFLITKKWALCFISCFMKYFYFMDIRCLDYYNFHALYECMKYIKVVCNNLLQSIQFFMTEDDNLIRFSCAIKAWVIWHLHCILAHIVLLWEI